MYTLQLLEEADQELQDAAVWYEQEKNGLGIRFIEVIQRKLQLINDNPERYPLRKGKFREAVVTVFPFVIVYTLYKKKKLIIIHSIFHTRRSPKEKYKKR